MDTESDQQAESKLLDMTGTGMLLATSFNQRSIGCHRKPVFASLRRTMSSSLEAILRRTMGYDAIIWRLVILKLEKTPIFHT